MKITIDSLSPKAIQDAIKKIEVYQKSLNDKCEEFVRKLAQIGVPVIDERMNQASFTYDNGIESGAETQHSTYIKVHSFDSYSEAILTVEGQDLLFIEFGAGAYYNGAAGSSPHPKGQEMGYRIGYYGKGYGKQKVWGYYGDDDELVLTHGIQATMPAYSAWQEMYKQIDKIAKEVFYSG